jgi:predicted DCC family thiol-disulfide oxidoreductase YuxK
MESPNKILYFDGVCNLCNGLVRFIIKADRRKQIKFSPLQSSAAGEMRMLNNISEDTVVYFSGNKYFTKSAAILRLLDDLGGAWRIFRILSIIPQKLRDKIYDMIARNRYRIFGRKETCIVPSPEVRERFIT